MQLKSIRQLILILCLCYGCNKTDTEILNKTVAQLTSIEKIEYNVVNEDFNKEYNVDRKDTAICYFDFSSKDSLIETKYHFISKFRGTSI